MGFSFFVHGLSPVAIQVHTLTLLLQRKASHAPFGVVEKVILFNLHCAKIKSNDN
jgi:hypothetical protein